MQDLTVLQVIYSAIGFMFLLIFIYLTLLEERHMIKFFKTEKGMEYLKVKEQTKRIRYIAKSKQDTYFTIKLFEQLESQNKNIKEKN